MKKRQDKIVYPIVIPLTEPPKVFGAGCAFRLKQETAPAKPYSAQNYPVL
jgi:hypothetical protein